MSMRSGVIGSWNIRAPVASKMALAITASVQTIAGSPPPLRSGVSVLDQERLDLGNPGKPGDFIGV